MNGGYDYGYRRSPCFWGTTPGSLVRLLVDLVPSFVGLQILDAGCGEGKNAIYLAQLGAIVKAIDVSPLALENAYAAWDVDKRQLCSWELGDVHSIDIPSSFYDVIVAYGLLHCLPNQISVSSVIERFRTGTKLGGYNIIVTFNARRQDLHAAHPGFFPCLLNHTDYVHMYSDWEIIHVSDSDLVEAHPDTNVKHSHSMTRILARKIAR